MYECDNIESIKLDTYEGASFASSYKFTQATQLFISKANLAYRTIKYTGPKQLLSSLYRTTLAY